MKRIKSIYEVVLKISAYFELYPNNEVNDFNIHLTTEATNNTVATIEQTQ